MIYLNFLCDYIKMVYECLIFILNFYAFLSFCRESGQNQKFVDSKAPSGGGRRALWIILYFPAPSPAKNSFVSFATVPDSRSRAMRFGMLISPLKVSAMLHSRPRSTVAPRMDTKE